MDKEFDNIEQWMDDAWAHAQEQRGISAEDLNAASRMMEEYFESDVPPDQAVDEIFGFDYDNMEEAHKFTPGKQPGEKKDREEASRSKTKPGKAKWSRADDKAASKEEIEETKEYDTYNNWLADLNDHITQFGPTSDEFDGYIQEMGEDAWKEGLQPSEFVQGFEEYQQGFQDRSQQNFGEALEDDGEAPGKQHRDYDQWMDDVWAYAQHHYGVSAQHLNMMSDKISDAFEHDFSPEEVVDTFFGQRDDMDEGPAGAALNVRANTPDQNYDPEDAFWQSGPEFKGVSGVFGYQPAGKSWEDGEKISKRNANWKKIRDAETALTFPNEGFRMKLKDFFVNEGRFDRDMDPDDWKQQRDDQSIDFPDRFPKKTPHFSQIQRAEKFRQAAADYAERAYGDDVAQEIINASDEDILSVMAHADSTPENFVDFKYSDHAAGKADYMKDESVGDEFEPKYGDYPPAFDGGGNDRGHEDEPASCPECHGNGFSVQGPEGQWEECSTCTDPKTGRTLPPEQWRKPRMNGLGEAHGQNAQKKGNHKYKDVAHVPMYKSPHGTKEKPDKGPKISDFDDDKKVNESDTIGHTGKRDGGEKEWGKFKSDRRAERNTKEPDFGEDPDEDMFFGSKEQDDYVGKVEDPTSSKNVQDTIDSIIDDPIDDIGFGDVEDEEVPGRWGETGWPTGTPDDEVMFPEYEGDPNYRKSDQAKYDFGKKQYIDIEPDEKGFYPRAPEKKSKRR